MRRLTRGRQQGSLLLAICGLVAPLAADAHPSLTSIDSARDAGEISASESALYKLQFIRNPNALPARFAIEAAPVKCGTEIVAEAQRELASQPSVLQSAAHAEMGALLARPVLSSHVDSEHFRIHFNDGGGNAPHGWPNRAYLDAVVAACEASYANYHRVEEWQVPPSDGTAGGGVGLIDCYIENISGVYGYTEAEDSPVDSWAGNRTAFFVIDNDYTGFDYADRTQPMQVTVAHEYHHVVQMGYTMDNPWWMENLSTYQENVVFGEVDDNFQYMAAFLGSPWRKQSTFNGSYPYGAFLWPTFLVEHWSHRIVTDIQACSGSQSIFACFDHVLGGVGSDHASAQAEWNVWNFYTSSSRSDGNHYREGARYPATLAYDKQISVFPAYGHQPSSTKQPEATGCSVQRFRPDMLSLDNLLTIHFNGPDCVEQVCVIAKRDGEQTFTEHYMALDASGNGAVDIHHWDEMEFAQMIVTFPRTCGNGAFDYSFDAETSAEPTAVGDFPALYSRQVVLDQNLPNPFGPSTRIGYSLEFDTPVVLSVYDAAGREVRNLINAAQPAGVHSVRWDGRAQSGERVTPGVYFYRLTAAGQAETRKMLLVE